jgi:hypothetical protein
VEKTTPTVCAVDTCSRTDIQGHGYCGRHYQSWRTHGDPVYQPPRFTECAIDECPRPPRSSRTQWCEAHYYRNRRNGGPLVAKVFTQTRSADSNHWVGQAVTYIGMHARIRREQGSAAARLCVDCGNQAREWSYDHADPDERQSKDGPYSADMRRYEPRCKSCHALFDQRAHTQ